MSGIDNDYLPIFCDELNKLIAAYSTKLSGAEVLGVLRLMSDDISEKTRKFNSGPHELS